MAKKTFEQSLKQLEKIISELESDDIPIETALKKFEEGIELSRYCSNILDETEKRVNLLLKKQDGTMVEKPFQKETENDSSDE
jgi:exodeoxyribonuclease VII small subunit